VKSALTPHGRHRLLPGLARFEAVDPRRDIRKRLEIDAGRFALRERGSERESATLRSPAIQSRPVRPWSNTPSSFVVSLVSAAIRVFVRFAAAELFL